MLLVYDAKFLPLHNSPTKGPCRRLEHTTDKVETSSRAYALYDTFSVQLFVEDMSEYAEYQHVCWLPGFMIDCNTALTADDYEWNGGREVN